MRHLVRAALLVGLLWSQIAAADELPGTRFTIGNWSGAAFDRDGAFSHCVVTAPYRSGISMHFSVSADWTWRVAWSNPVWKLTPGQSIPVTYWIDGFAPRQAMARAQQPTLAIAELPAQAETFDQFRRGYALTVVAEGQRFQFSLQDTFASLTALAECVNRYRQVAGMPPRPGALPRATLEQRLEATKVVANIMARTDIADFRILSDAEIKRLALPYLETADVVWLAEGLLGLLRILPRGAIAGTDELLATVLAQDAKACKGNFVSGFTDDVPPGTVRRMFSACATTLTSNIFRYTVVPWQDGAIWLFVTGGRHGAQADRQTIDRAEIGLRKAIHEVAGR